LYGAPIAKNKPRKAAFAGYLGGKTPKDEKKAIDKENEQKTVNSIQQSDQDFGSPEMKVRCP
jgi:hypothetical protein